MNKLFKYKIIVAIIICVLIVINNILYIKYIQMRGDTNKIENSKQILENNNNNDEEIEQKSEEEQKLEKLKSMNERDRMEYYFSEFISYIKSEDYSKAYELLYPEFKENYFKTQEEFRDYVRKIYPKSIAFSYNDIQRQGYVYVLIIDVIDPTQKSDAKKSQRIVIQENDFNDFVLSFQVI